MAPFALPAHLHDPKERLAVGGLATQRQAGRVAEELQSVDAAVRELEEVGARLQRLEERLGRSSTV
jgi:hypothetical protein